MIGFILSVAVLIYYIPCRDCVGNPAWAVSEDAG